MVLISVSTVYQKPRARDFSCNLLSESAWRLLCRKHVWIYLQAYFSSCSQKTAAFFARGAKPGWAPQECSITSPSFRTTTLLSMERASTQRGYSLPFLPQEGASSVASFHELGTGAGLSTL